MGDKKPNQTALQKMQDIANRLISNTPELSKILDEDSVLRPKRPFSPNSKKNTNAGKSQVNKNNGYVYSSNNKGQMTSNDYHEKCKQLANDLQLSRDKIFSLQQEIIIIKQRFVQRQIQYRKIIEQLQDQIKCKSTLDHSDRNRKQLIDELHKQILDNIGTIQNKTSKILIEQQSDIRRFFHKKINQIKQKFKEDKINKTQKDQQYIEKQKQMMSELDWIKNIAHKIDLQNQTLMKKYSSLKTEYEIQQKDKDLLLKQLLTKKKQNAILKSQVQQYEKLLNEVSKQMQQNDMKNDHSSDQIANEALKIQKGYPKAMGLSKGHSKKQMNTINSRLSVGQNSNRNAGQKYQNTVAHLNNIINKQRKKIRDLKSLYMRQIGNKSDLQKILRKLVDDVRDSIVEVQRQRTRKKRSQNQLDYQSRQKLLQQLLSNEKILTLIYDKAFYSGGRVSGNDKIPQDLQKILENNDQQGFC